MKRREFIERVGGAGMFSSLWPLLPRTDQRQREPLHELQGALDLGNTHSLLGYKRMILDYHFSEHNPTTLKNANGARIVEAMKKLGIDSLLLYAKDHWGNCYYATREFKRHRNVPQDLFGEVLEGCHKSNIK